MQREILHINTDDFYASALRLRDPGLKGRPVIVAGPTARGSVLSASYEARSDGVKRGMTVSEARRLCPGGLFIRPDWEFFRKVSRGIFGVMGRYSPVVEAVSLDEGYVDYTGCGRVFGHALDAGRRIKDGIYSETGLDVSVGAASSKLVSHVASRTAKRAHMVDVYPGCEKLFLAPVEIERFPIVGEKRAPILRGLGIRCVGDVLKFTEEILDACFGPWGARLYRGAMGEDLSAVRGSSGGGEAFRIGQLVEPDTVDRCLLESFIYRLSGRLGERLRCGRALAGSVSLEIDYSDGVRGRGAARPAAATCDDGAIFDAAAGIFRRVFVRRVRVRRIFMEAGRIEPEPPQLGLLAPKDAAPRERARRIQSTLDLLRARFGEGAAPAFGRSMAALRAGVKGEAQPRAS